MSGSRRLFPRTQQPDSEPRHMHFACPSRGCGARNSATSISGVPRRALAAYHMSTEEDAAWLTPSFPPDFGLNCQPPANTSNERRFPAALLRHDLCRVRRLRADHTSRGARCSVINLSTQTRRALVLFGTRHHDVNSDFARPNCPRLS